MNEIAMTSTPSTPNVASPESSGLDRLRPYAGWIRWLAIGLLVIAIFLFMGGLPVREGMEAMKGFIGELGIWGMVIYAVVYAVATVLLLPGSPLTITAGLIFGPLWGTLTVVVGANFGAALALLIGRYLARDKVAKWAEKNPRFQAVDRAIETGGWKIVAMLRLSPAIPFNLQNYLYGLTGIRFWTAVLTSVVAMLPGTFLYVYIGHIGRLGAEAAAGGEQTANLGKYIMLGLGLVATVLVTVYITKAAKRALEEQTGIDPDADPDSTEGAETAQQSAEPESESPASLRGPLAWLTIAVLALVLAACARFTGAMEGLFGPPPVTMAETYAGDTGNTTFDHSAFDTLVNKYVDEQGGVDYEGLMTERDALRIYIQRVGEAPFDDLSRDGKLALLINAYNAFTLELILEHWDGGNLESIRDIPNQWTDQRWVIAGQTYSLNQIEHEQIRPKFKEPRIHWVLVCAAVGCPPLRTEAYTAEQLDDQLAEQEQYVHSHPRWYRLDKQAGELHLTSLYKWYGGDFEQTAGSVLKYVADIKPEVQQMLDAGNPPRVQWLNYDWSLNTQENMP